MTVVVNGPLVAAEVGPMCERLRSLLEDPNVGSVACDLGGLREPDLGTVDELAQLHMAAGKLGCHLVIRTASSGLRELVALMGLTDTLLVAEALPLHVRGATGSRGKAEQREQAGGVQEEHHPADPIA